MNLKGRAALLLMTLADWVGVYDTAEEAVAANPADLRLIEAALRSVRADALEEAADLCERRAEGLPKGSEAREQAEALAFVIRDLKGAP